MIQNRMMKYDLVIIGGGAAGLAAAASFIREANQDEQQGGTVSVCILEKICGRGNLFHIETAKRRITLLSKVP